MNITIGNFGDGAITILEGQQSATANPHPSLITESPITYAEVLCIEEGENHTYKKCTLSARNTAVMHKYLDNSQNSHADKDQKPVTAEEIDLSGVNKIFCQRIRDTLKNI